MDWFLYSLLVVFILIPLLKFVCRQMAYFLDRIGILKEISKFAYVIGDVVSLGLIVLLTHLQLNHQWFFFSEGAFNVKDALTLSFAILGVYGIYFGFLQFLVGFDKHDMYLGRSKTNHLINNIGWHMFIHNVPFKVLLFLLMVLPIMIGTYEHTHFTNVLMSLWQTSVIFLLVIYIFLLMNSLRAIQSILSIKQHDDYALRWDIETKLKTQYKNYFVDDYKNGRSLFFFALDSEIEHVKDHELLTFYKHVFQGTLEHDTIDQLKKMNERPIHHVYQTFLRKKWDHLLSANLTYHELLILYQSDLGLLHRLIKDDETKVIQDYTDHHRIWPNHSIHRQLFDRLFNQAETKQDVHQLIQIVNEQINWKIPYYQEEGTKAYFNRFKGELYDILLECYLDQHRQLVGIQTISQLKESSQTGNKTHSKYVFNSLTGSFGSITSKLTQHERENYRALLNTIDTEYRMAYILYQLFYPTKGEWDVNADFYQSLLKGLNKPFNKKAFTTHVSDIISGTHIGDDLTYDTCEWLFDVKGRHLTYTFFSHIRQRNLPLLKVLLFQRHLVHHVFDLPSPKLESPCLKSQQTLLDINRDMLYKVSSYPDSLHVDYIRRTLVTIVHEAQTYKEIKEFYHMSYMDMFILDMISQDVRAYLNGEQIREILYQAYMSEELCLFYMLKLHDEDYQYVFRDQHFLTLFLSRIRGILQKKNMNVPELVDELVSTIEPFHIMGKYEVELIDQTLQTLLDAKYLPL